ncbi:hypothetical protein ZIOFF_053937 [Zingiber officinale]|uniref:Uncharacterized protein n=1 Tax=Zingiber officinale TaxID=94328 RepID=A0A8J5FE90_ZINOF|nr:hypothetical protein ZIOFF_053937 [Zingiber officinale]
MEKKRCNHFSRGWKKPDGKELDLEEGRNSKQSAVFSYETHRTEMFDEILLFDGEKCAKRVDELRVKLQNEVSKISHSSHNKGSNGRKGSPRWNWKSVLSLLGGNTSSSSEILKAYQLYLAACPFKKISHFFSTQTILNVFEKAEKLHIIDFGIYYGFQWPCFMKVSFFQARMDSADSGDCCNRAALG